MQNKDITIIIPFLNEGEEPEKTIESIYATTTQRNFNIIAIDDCSSIKSNIRFKDITLIRNKHRIGVDECRQLGSDLSTTPNILILDSHMRFPNNKWLEKILDCLYREPNTIWCSTCSVLGYGNMDINRTNDRYYGATIKFIDKENDTVCGNILEPKWINRLSQESEYEIPCILGANYFINKKWFDFLHGLRGLKMWGTSEPFLSLKSWMAGGKCKINTDIEIGHKFRDTAPYSTVVWNMIYNKLYLCKTILPEKTSEKLIELLPKDGNFNKAMKEIEANKELIEQEKKYYKSIFKVSLENLCDKFEIEKIG